MTGAIKGFIKFFMDGLRVDITDIMVNNCIINLENVCPSVLGFQDIIKKVVQSVNFIHS